MKDLFSRFRHHEAMGRLTFTSFKGFEFSLLHLWETSAKWSPFPSFQVEQEKFAIEQIETKYKGSTLESQFYPELESHMCTWLGNQLSENTKRKANNRCANPSAGVMHAEYYFSVFPKPDAQATQLSTYIRRPYNQATTAPGVIQKLELWMVSVEIHREVAGLMLSLTHMRKAFFRLIQPSTSCS